MEKIAILGAGSWGTALAISLANNHHPNVIWCRNKAQAEEMQNHRTNQKYLKDVTLPETITVTNDLQDAIKDAKYIVLAVVSQSIREITEKIKNDISSDAILINVAKGLELETNLRMSQVVGEIVSNPFVALYGPSHAEEVSKGMPTLIVSASDNEAAAKQVQDIFFSPSLRVYTNQDLIGVELGGALKNIIALANGIAAGLGYGDNCRAALLTRGLAEISRLGVELGGKPHTFLGLTGIGDLVVTCNSEHSRNRRAGFALGQGKKLDVVLEEMGMVVEGVYTTKAAVELARTLGVQMPISEQIYDVLFNDADVNQAVGMLMSRDKKGEEEYFWQ